MRILLQSISYFVKVFFFSSSLNLLYFVGRYVACIQFKRRTNRPTNQPTNSLPPERNNNIRQLTIIHLYIKTKKKKNNGCHRSHTAPKTTTNNKHHQRRENIFFYGKISRQNTHILWKMSRTLMALQQKQQQRNIKTDVKE